VQPLGERLYIRIRERKANAYIGDDGRLMLKNPHRLSAELKTFIADNADELMAYVEKIRAETEERAAIIEYGAKVPREVAEEAARQLVQAIPFAPAEDQSFLTTACCEVIDRIIAPYADEHRRAA
jgi:hypothetical protein